MTCKACNQPSDFLFLKKVLNKYEVKYYRCRKCLFIQTEDPYWLDEAYQNIITSLDIGLVGRNIYLATITDAVLTGFFDTRSKFLDYGGGYGMHVRLMRDRGFDYYRQDKFCENLFAKGFDIEDLVEKDNFELVTAFELFEHLKNPLEELEIMLKYGKSVFFSTELQPAHGDLSSWEYFAFETGQHIALYHYRSLQEISKKFKLNLYSNGRNLHLLTPKKINPLLYKLLTKQKIASVYNKLASHPPSFLQADYNAIKEKLNS